MFKHVLIATDGSELAQKAVANGFALAKALEARVTVVTVTDIYPTGPYSPIPLPSIIEHYEAAAALSASQYTVVGERCRNEAWCLLRDDACNGPDAGGRHPGRGETEWV